MTFYGITLISLDKELRAADLGLLSPFYADDVAFNVLARQSAHLLKLLMYRGPDQRYFPEMSQALVILDTLGQKEEEKREFSSEGVALNFFSGGRFLGVYLGSQEELEAWVKPQVEAWAHRVRVLGKISQ